MLAVAVLLWWQLYGRGFAGLADNGDWPRLMRQVGLAFSPDDRLTYGERLVRFLPHSDAGLDWQSYPTSAGSLVRLVVAADRAVQGRAPFDIGVLGFAYAVSFLACLYGLLRSTRRLRPVPRVVAVAFGGLLVTDFAFTAYFHSLYSEPVAIIAVLAAVAAGLRWSTQLGSIRWAAMTCLALLTALTAKAQYAPTGLLIALALAVVAVRALSRRVWQRGIVTAMVAVLLLGAAAADTTLQPSRLVRYNTWDATYVEILPHTGDPSSALRELGLDTRLAAFSGRNAYQSGTPLHDARLSRQFPMPVPSRERLLVYWTRHPGQLVSLLWRGHSGLREWRPQYLANTTTAPHYPRRTLLSGGTFWSGTVRALGPVATPVVLVVLLTGLVAPLASRRRRALAPDTRGPLSVLSLISLAASSQYAAVLLGDGRYELVKHLLLFDLLWGATAVGLLVWAATSLPDGIGQAASAPRGELAGGRGQASPDGERRSAALLPAVRSRRQ